MAENQLTPLLLPENVLESAAMMAEKEHVSVSELVQKLIARHERALAWKELQEYARERADVSGYKEEDVVRLVREVRAERAAERKAEEEDRSGR
jgi:ABC-type nitrate/sulfonate/bicarbonate transport system substrate-binding protein